jgi:TRAP-type C4-dicarboxylate transport system substrate-binding protein
MGNVKRITFFLMAVVLVVTLLTSAYAASTPTREKPAELKYGGLYGPTHPYSRAAQDWMKKVEEESNGRVHFTAYWGGSLYGPKESWTELVKGVADVNGDGIFEYGPTGFTILKVMGTFFYGMSGPEVARSVYKETFNKFREIRSEFDGAKVVSIAGVSPYRFITKKPVNTIEDLKGLMIRCVATDVPYLQAIGMEPINMPMGEAYMAMQKGIIDAIWAPIETLKSMRFAEVSKYASEDSWRPWAFPKGVMNINTYNSLPPDIQKIVDDTGEFWGKTISNNFEELDKVGIEFGKSQGVTFFKLSPQDAKKVDDAKEVVALQKAKELDAKGLPGTEIYKEVRRLIEKYNK